MHGTSPERRKANFKGALFNLQTELQRKGVPFLVVGSIAVSSYTGEELDFDRNWILSEDKATPDIDLIVPRANIVDALTLRERYLKRPIPVKVGLGIPLSKVDYLPDSNYSFLTPRGVVLPFENNLVEPVQSHFEDVPIITVSPMTLYQGIGVFGSKIRKKDHERGIALRDKYALRLDGPEYASFDKARYIHSIGVFATGRLKEIAASYMPTSITKYVLERSIHSK